MDIPKIGSYYRHYKGGFYRVLAIATHTESEETLVIYESTEKPNTWARPLWHWQTLNEEGKPRFQEYKRFVI